MAGTLREESLGPADFSQVGSLQAAADWLTQEEDTEMRLSVIGQVLNRLCSFLFNVWSMTKELSFFVLEFGE